MTLNIVCLVAVGEQSIRLVSALLPTLWHLSNESMRTLEVVSVASCGGRSPGKLTRTWSGVAALVLLDSLPKQEGFVLTQLVLNLSSLVAETDGGRLSGAQPVLGVFQSQMC